MENFNDPAPEQAQLYQLILKANQQQTQEIKAEFHTVTCSLSEKLEEAYREIKKLKEGYKDLERKAKKNNIIVFGIQVDNQDNILENTLKVINTTLGCGLLPNDVNDIYKLEYSQDAPMLIEFISYLKKRTLFNSTEKLTQLKKAGVTIKNDMSKDDRETLKILTKHRRIARLENADARMKGLKLIVDGVSYSAEQLEENLRHKEGNSAAEDSEADTSLEVEGIPEVVINDRGRREVNEKKKNTGKPSPVNTRKTKKRKN